MQSLILTSALQGKYYYYPVFYRLEKTGSWRFISMPRKFMKKIKIISQILTVLFTDAKK